MTRVAVTLVTTCSAKSHAACPPPSEHRNACFVSNAEHLLAAGSADLWVHGHTHDSVDYLLGSTRVVCNPRGYMRNGVAENPCFDVDLLVEVAGSQLQEGLAAYVDGDCER